MAQRGTNKKFGRVRSQRKALAKSLETALIERGRITTTQAKAKALTREIAKLITLAKRQTLAARRQALKSVGTVAAEKLMKDVAVRFAERAGGYTRLIKIGRRPSDGSPMAIVELTA